MRDTRLSRRQVLKGAGAIGVLGALGIPTTVFADDEEVELLRWDLIQIRQSLVLAGGEDKAKAGTHVLTLTGSGQAMPKKRMATGGGTFMHKNANIEVAHGVYKVTGFQSWKAGGGSLGPTGLSDGIGTIAQTIGGVLVMHITMMPSSAASFPAVLGVHCELPGVEFQIHEGVTVDTSTLHFKQSSGFTVFHVLHGEHRD